MKLMSKLARIVVVGASLGLLGQAQAEKYGVACITNTLPRMASFRAKAVTNYEVVSVVKGKSVAVYSYADASGNPPKTMSVWLDSKLNDKNDNKYYDVQLAPSDSKDCAGPQYLLKTDAKGKVILVKR